MKRSDISAVMSELARKRWANVTPSERSRRAKMMLQGAAKRRRKCRRSGKHGAEFYVKSGLRFCVGCGARMKKI